MFYLEYFFSIVMIMSFIFHVHINELYYFLLYNFSPVVFGFLSLWSMREMTNESSLTNILNFIIYDQSGLWFFVEVFFVLFAFCVLLMVYNAYMMYKEEGKSK